jgi:hypothetical protein
MANKNFQNYAVAGNNVALTYDNVNDTVTIDVNVDKTDVGLGNVDNTSDINKPISTLVQNALNLKEGTITAGTTAQYYRGDKTFQTLDKTAVGLSNVDNTTDLLKPISTATQTALNGKQGLATNLTSISALTFASTSFVKMTAAGTFALDTATYLTAESDTLASVTGRGNSTTTAVTMAKLTLTGAVSGVGNASSYTVTAASGSAISKQITSTLVASANGDALVGLDINPTFTNGAFTVNNYGLRVTGNIVPSADNLYNLGISPLRFASVVGFQSIFTYYYAPSSQASFFGSSANTSINFPINNTVYARFHATTGNLTLQNGGTFTDSGFRLDVNGTARIQNQLTTTGSITAASAIARGVYMNQTLVASANGDTLVGLDINPTFTVGSFTGLTQLAVRVKGQILINNSTGSISAFYFPEYTDVYGSEYSFNTHGAFNISFKAQDTGNIIFRTGATNKIQLFNGGNVVIQNGGTFTDAGFRLDVNGTARVQNVLTLGSLSADPTGANGMIYYNTTTNRFKVYQNGAWATVTAI